LAWPIIQVPSRVTTCEVDGVVVDGDETWRKLYVFNAKTALHILPTREQEKVRHLPWITKPEFILILWLATVTSGATRSANSAFSKESQGLQCHSFHQFIVMPYDSCRPTSCNGRVMLWVAFFIIIIIIISVINYAI
jgi:hypothetical protein